MATFDASVEAWRALAVEHGGDVPTDFALAWIKVESDGQPCATGAIAGSHVQEAGIGQIYFEHPGDVVYGETSASLRTACVGTTGVQSRELSDDEKQRQINTLLDDIRDKRDRARELLASAGVDWNEDSVDFWCLVKCVHGLPLLANLVPVVRPESWAEFKQKALALSLDDLQAYQQRSDWPYRRSQFPTIFANAEKTGRYGGPAAPSLLAGRPSSAPSLLALLGLMFWPKRGGG